MLRFRLHKLVQLVVAEPELRPTVPQAATGPILGAALMAGAQRLRIPRKAFLLKQVLAVLLVLLPAVLVAHPGLVLEQTKIVAGRVAVRRIQDLVQAAVAVLEVLAVLVAKVDRITLAALLALGQAAVPTAVAGQVLIALLLNIPVLQAAIVSRPVIRLARLVALAGQVVTVQQVPLEALVQVRVVAVLKIVQQLAQPGALALVVH